VRSREEARPESGDGEDGLADGFRHAGQLSGGTRAV
jgi:hypothetical protein